MIKRPGPLVQMTLALVGLCGMLVILADLFFSVLPDRGAQAMQFRKNVTEAVAVQVTALLQADEPALLQRTLDNVATRTEGVKSIAIRRADGDIAAQAGDHARYWRRAVADDTSTPEQVTVPLNAGGARWGTFEVAFAGNDDSVVLTFMRQPLVLTLLFVSFAGTLAFGLYMRRALQHLDPASVIPERVQGAFDAMAEGVVVLDARSRVLLANKAFRQMHRQAHTVGVGQNLSALPWLGECLSPNVEEHPWTRAIAERSGLSGITLELGRGDIDARHVVINCVPITDPGGAVRGCLATFNDVSELHRANLALREAVTALNRSNEEVQRQNAELERLATRDPLTGCLNRRAFHEAFQALLSEAKANRQPLSCLMVDIDHFKAVNDSYGHQLGDRVIQEVAKKLIECARTTDLVCRYGGEEFCVVLPGMPLPDALGFAERVRSRIENECGIGVREVDGLKVTASLGIDSLSRQATSVAQLIDQADQALYRAKRGGRNQVREFAASRDALVDASRIDSVSGFLMREAFQGAFDACLREAGARGQLVCGIKFAVDPYQTLLRDRGQAAADVAVSLVARLLRESVRPMDLLVRLDAEHLAVVAPGLSVHDALLLAESVRARVEQEAAAPSDAEPDLYRLTVTAGVDALPANASGASTLMARANKALMRAKRGGRNSVYRFSPEAAAMRPVGQETAAASERS